MPAVSNDVSTIKDEIRERNLLQGKLSDLSVEKMGTDADAAPRNDAQMLSVIQALYDIQVFREGWESDISHDDNTFIDFKKTVSVKHQLEQKAQSFKQLVNQCLLSFSEPSRQDALEYLKEIEALYDASHKKIMAMADQKSQSLFKSSSAESNTKQKEQLRVASDELIKQKQAAHMVEKISSDFQAANNRISQLYIELEGYYSHKKLTARDEADYFREIILDKIKLEIDQMKQLEKKLKIALPYTSLPFEEQEKKILAKEREMKIINRTYAESVFSSVNIELGTQASYKIPPRLSGTSTDRIVRLQRLQEKELKAQSEDKSKLLIEINRIKGLIQNMTENLTHEIPKVVFGQGLKTYKRNKLLILSRKLYVSEQSSLGELRSCVSKFEKELAKCQSDAKLRQGTMRKDCRKLIDSLANELKEEQHIFKGTKL